MPVVTINMEHAECNINTKHYLLAIEVTVLVNKNVFPLFLKAAFLAAI
jgi:hypothetical protein